MGALPRSPTRLRQTIKSTVRGRSLEAHRNRNQITTLTMAQDTLLITQFDFVLPRGLLDEVGNLHQQGKMRLATARDELGADKDRRSQDSSTYRSLVMLAQVITQLGSLSQVTVEQLEGLFTKDLAYLREFYNRINQQGTALIPTQCPHCSQPFEVELALSGESLATP